VNLRSSAIALAALLGAAACSTNPSQRANSASARRALADTPGCLDTLKASDSISTIVKVSIVPQDSTVKLPNEFEQLFAETLRPRFRVPSKLPLSVVIGQPPCDSLGYRCVGGVLNLGAVIYIHARNDGTLSEATIVDETTTPALADSLRAALMAMSKANEVPWFGQADSIALVIRVEPDDGADTVQNARRLFKAIIPRYNAPFSYATMPAAGVDAPYPLSARLAGVEDSVTIAFTVRADGTIAAESLDLLSANYREFVVSVFNAMIKTRYHPAHLGDCAVATRMKQRFMFKVPQ
jgi:TonB-like protein